MTEERPMRPRYFEYTNCSFEATGKTHASRQAPARNSKPQTPSIPTRWPKPHTPNSTLNPEPYPAPRTFRTISSDLEPEPCEVDPVPETHVSHQMVAPLVVGYNTEAEGASIQFYIDVGSRV